MTTVQTADRVITEPAKGSTAERRSVGGASFGFFVDMFDIYLPVIVLGPALSFFLPDTVSTDTKRMLIGLIFASTLVARPLGSVIFGMLGDKIGRKRATVYSMAGAGVATGLIALLPGYQSIGLWAVGLLILLRFVDGVFLGGEYTGAVPLAMEHSRRSKRGRNAGIIALGFPSAGVFISALTLLMLTISPAAGPTSAYATWGWRVPFAIGALMSVAFAVYYAVSVKESSAWKSTTTGRVNPLKELVAGRHRSTLLQVFLLMTGVWFASNATVVILPTVIGDNARISSSQTTIVLIVAQAILALSYPLAGSLSQRIGRRRFFTLCGWAAGLICAPLFVLFASGTVSGVLGATVVVTALLLTGVTTFGAIGAYMSERFPVEIRSTGYGVGYSLALVIPSFYAFYQGWLEHVMPYKYTPAALLVIGAICLVVGALWGPETKDVDIKATAVD
jgi:MFS family permease